MKAFEKIIGYRNEKKELMRLADILKNPEYYKKLDVTPPKGLLLDGHPGMGKTLIANVLIEASGRKSFVCRKDKPNGSFVNHIVEIFEEAKKNAPSIILLDDMDKFANQDEAHKNAEEYVAVQSCIDDVKDFDVFVVATTNNRHNLPESLTRAGRFDRIMCLGFPNYEDSLAIIRHYLKNKEIMLDVDIEYIAKLLCFKSCATIESIIASASRIAGFERSDKIKLSHFIEAAAVTVFREDHFCPTDKEIDLTDSNSLLSEIVYHEVGHALVHEILSPESVTLVAVGETSGYTSSCQGYIDDDTITSDFDIMTSLGGIAAIDQIYGRKGSGCSSDITKARNVLNNAIRRHGRFGLGLTTHSYRYETDGSIFNQEVASDSILELYYEKTRKIVARNREFLELLANELAKKKFLTMYDVQRIKKACKIKEVDVL